MVGDGWAGKIVGGAGEMGKTEIATHRKVHELACLLELMLTSNKLSARRNRKCLLDATRRDPTLCRTPPDVIVGSMASLQE